MELASKLDSVTVYARGALCLRRAPLNTTERQVRLVGLPLSLAPGSLRARVENCASGPRVLDVRAGYDVKLPDQVNVPAEHQALEVAEEALLRLRQEMTRLDRELSELKAVSPVFPAARPGEPPRSAPVGALLQAADFVDQQLKRRFERRRVLHQSVEEAGHEVELRRRRIAEASTSLRADRVQLHRTAEVTLSGPVSGEGAELCLEYFVDGARWAPSYDLRLERGLGSGQLTMRAAVAQRTGEDWSGVRLGLSTAALDRRTDLPELRSLKIGRSQPAPPRSGWRDPPPGLDALFEGFDGAWRRAPQAPPASQAMPTELGELMKEPAPRKKKSRSRDEPAAPPPIHLERSASAMLAPPAPKVMAGPPMAAAPARMRRAAIGFGRGGAASGGAPPGAVGGAFHGQTDGEPAAEPSMDGGAESLDEALAQSLSDQASAAEAVELGAPLRDYDRLMMSAATEPGSRGRLQVAPERPFAMVALASLHVEVLVAIIAEADRQARGVGDRPLPRGAVAPHAGSFDYRYHCVHRVDVPSSDEWTVVPVMAADVGLLAEYSCVPAVEPQVYRTVRLHNRSTHALLQGPVDVSVGDEFLLTAELPLIAPGSTDARLGLGVEEAIKVSRKTQFKETTGGLLGGSTVLPHEIEIEVNNRLTTPALIEVRERVPVSFENDVKIEESQVRPPWEKDENLRDGEATAGARAWRLTVAAGQKAALSAQYVIRIPSGQMLVGGNRRV